MNRAIECNVKSNATNGVLHCGASPRNKVNPQGLVHLWCPAGESVFMTGDEFMEWAHGVAAIVAQKEKAAK